MKKFLLNLLFRWLVPTLSDGVDRKEELRILATMNEISGMHRWLEGFISNDVRFFFRISEKDGFQRGLRKGMVIRIKWLLDEMLTAKKELEELNKVK